MKASPQQSIWITRFAKVGLFVGGGWFFATAVVGNLYLLSAGGGDLLDAVWLLAFSMFTTIVIAASIGAVGALIGIGVWGFGRIGQKQPHMIQDEFDPHRW